MEKHNPNACAVRLCGERRAPVGWLFVSDNSPWWLSPSTIRRGTDHIKELNDAQLVFDLSIVFASTMFGLPSWFRRILVVLWTLIGMMLSS